MKKYKSGDIAAGFCFFKNYVFEKQVISFQQSQVVKNFNQWIFSFDAVTGCKFHKFLTHIERYSKVSSPEILKIWANSCKIHCLYLRRELSLRLLPRVWERQFWV
jgi:hypothetical protein